eukprot:TRINITY_DN2812_c0_g1_i4.p1 TRINITY_DN2812_c0_g1~~TRINITY_DN2812_c0_g1_i4.p1  ORF type:complete len:161 (-),score=39.43 TRINITY_DN2812_c0_g1_i4:25-507(-)
MASFHHLLYNMVLNMPCTAVVHMTEQNAKAAAALHSAAQVPEMTPELLAFLNKRGPATKTLIDFGKTVPDDAPFRPVSGTKDRPLPTSRTKVVKGPEKAARGRLTEAQMAAVLLPAAAGDWRAQAAAAGFDAAVAERLRKYVQAPVVQDAHDGEQFAEWE